MIRNLRGKLEALARKSAGTGSPAGAKTSADTESPANTPSAAPSDTPSAGACYVREFFVQPGEWEESLRCAVPEAMNRPGLSRRTFEELCKQLKLAGGWTLADCLFFDTETTGLSLGTGTQILLLGVGSFQGDRFRVAQYFVRNPGEEGDMLRRFERDLAGRKALVSFNGRRYDLPLLESRMVLNRLRTDLTLPHLDLLLPARRIFKYRLGSCSLGNLEQRMLGTHREGDVSGSAIPGRYFNYVNSGDFELVEDILRHNLMDVLSMVHLLVRMEGMLESPLETAEALDLYGIGRSLAVTGDERERACYRASWRISPTAHAGKSLSMTEKRRRNYGEAARLWEEMAGRGMGGLMPYAELAKLCEHRTLELEKARHWTAEGLALARAFGDERGEAAFLHRLSRLEKKLGR